MTATVSFTPCWRKPEPVQSAGAAAAFGRLHLGPRAVLVRSILLVVGLLLLALCSRSVWAEAVPEITQMQVEQRPDGMFLSAQVQFDLPSAVEDALLKGIGVVFVSEAEIYRSRWYWADKRVAGVQRFTRLSYQPLTRRWRVQTAREPFTGAGQGLSFSQHFDSMGDALSSLRRIANWKVAEAADIEPDARHGVEFRFRLDLSQLPRPFQIGALGQPEWNLTAVAVQRLPPQGAK
jgi:Domain of unknown function (DUF4390)